MIKYTKDIPVCPVCNKGTKRTFIGSNTTTQHYPPVYDAKGNILNPDNGTIEKTFQCNHCRTFFHVSSSLVHGVDFSIDYVK